MFFAKSKPFCFLAVILYRERQTNRLAKAKKGVDLTLCFIAESSQNKLSPKNSNFELK